MRVNPESKGNATQPTVPSSLTGWILKNNPVKKSTASKGPNSSYAKGYKAGVAVGKLKSSSASITKSMKKEPLVKMGNAAKAVASNEIRRYYKTSGSNMEITKNKAVAARREGKALGAAFAAVPKQKKAVASNAVKKYYKTSGSNMEIMPKKKAK